MTANSLANMTEVETRLAGRIDSAVAAGLDLSSSVGGIGFTNALQVMEFAKMMAVSGVSIPKHLRGNPGACLAVAIQAIEWRMSPFAVANKSYSVNDRLAFESQLIQAVILQRAPLKGRFRYAYFGQGSTRKVRVEATTKDGEIVDYETPEIGKIPVQNSPLWKGDPDQQLAYYAGRALCRRHFPDVILGVYSPDEAEMMPRDPAAARDVTPAASLSDRMSSLAAPRHATPPHDPETGAISKDDDNTDRGGSVDAAKDSGGESPQSPPESDPSPDDDFPGDRPSPSASDEEIEAAFQAGVSARADGVGRRAIPAEMRSAPALSEAWLRGWDS